jgi:hypothetical protein
MSIEQLVSARASHRLALSLVLGRLLWQLLFLPNRSIIRSPRGRC